ncbi:MAG TPA: DUF1254 domain-containing protein [Bacteroidales bacterium]|nr:DUF1254 domain-containing protein [Bacteroidales bacterium]
MNPARFPKVILLLLTVTLLLPSCKKDKSSSNDETAAIISDAYIYAYPLILMKITENKMTNVIQSTNTGCAPLNQLSHCNTMPDYTFFNVVSPNVDTFYSIAWLDLEKEPIVVSVPDATLYKPAGAAWRYYLLQIMDAWSNVFASPGVRTNGPGASTFLISGPNWSGAVPGGMLHYKSPTNMAWINGRTMVIDQNDATTVMAFQNAMTIMPLSAWPGPYSPPGGTVNDSIDMVTAPVQQVASLPVEKYFQMLCDLMKENPASKDDSAMVRELAQVGITPGGTFDLSKFPASEQLAINTGYANGKANLINSGHTIQKTTTNGWGFILSDIGAYGNHYDTRAYVAMIGLGANLPDDAVYPTTTIDNLGDSLTSLHRYTMTFAPGQTPPDSGFWSITLYNDQHFLVQNEIGRYAIGSYNNLTYNADSSLTLYIQKDSTGIPNKSNWLPTAEPDNSVFNLMMRIYWPRKSVLNNEWKIPAVVRVN